VGEGREKESKMRTTFDRDFYRPRPSEGCENLRVRTYPDLPGTEIWTYECDNGGNYVAAFGGKRAKPDFHERYRDPENREHRISEYLKGARMRLTALSPASCSTRAGVTTRPTSTTTDSKS
jgi:hypothetical protein